MSEPDAVAANVIALGAGIWSWSVWDNRIDF